MIWNFKNRINKADLNKMFDILMWHIFRVNEKRGDVITILFINNILLIKQRMLKIPPNTKTEIMCQFYLTPSEFKNDAITNML